MWNAGDGGPIIYQINNFIYHIKELEKEKPNFFRRNKNNTD
jgi:hypothetical protein